MFSASASPFVSIFILAHLSHPLGLAIAGPILTHPYSHPNPNPRQIFPPTDGDSTNFWMPLPFDEPNTDVLFSTLTIPLGGSSPGKLTPTSTLPSEADTDDAPSPTIPIFSLSNTSSSSHWSIPSPTFTPTLATPTHRITQSPTPNSNPTGTQNITNVNPNPNSATVENQRRFDVLYLVPLFSLLGFFFLVGFGWLLHGCCTRKPKFRSPFSFNSSRLLDNETFDSSHNVVERGDGIGIGIGSGSGSGFNKEVEGVGGVSREVVGGRGSSGRIGSVGVGKRERKIEVPKTKGFKAFRYEDFKSQNLNYYNPNHAGSQENQRLMNIYTNRECNHIREYGFECDCRPSLVELEERNRFVWPSIRDEGLESNLNGKGNEDEDGEGYIQVPKKRYSIRQQSVQSSSGRVLNGTGKHSTLVSGSGSKAGFLALEALSDPCSDQDHEGTIGRTSVSEEKRRFKRIRTDQYQSQSQSRYPQSYVTGNKQDTSLQEPYVQDNRRDKVPRRAVTTAGTGTGAGSRSRGKRMESKSFRSFKIDDENDDEGEGEGFRMIIESPRELDLALSLGNSITSTTSTTPTTTTLQSTSRSTSKDLSTSNATTISFGPRNGSGRDTWVEKVMDAIGSSFSRFSSGTREDEDRYTSLPGPEYAPNSNTGTPRSIKSRTANGKAKVKEELPYRSKSACTGSTGVDDTDDDSVTPKQRHVMRYSTCPGSTTTRYNPHLHPHLRPHSQSRSQAQTQAQPKSQSQKNFDISRNKVVLPSEMISSSKSTNVNVNVDDDELQKRRLDIHRQSLASLPVGMMFSPPLVGLATFES